MKVLLAAGLLLLGATVSRGANSVTPWVPIFQGIDQATGTNNGSSIQLSVDALRVDLHDPSVRLLVTPPVTNNFISDQRETLLQTPRDFMREHGLQVAINGSYFQPGGYSFPSGSPSWLAGVVLSQGRTVSVQTSSNDSLSAVLFTTNNQPTFAAINWPPADTEGIYTAIPGLYPLLVDGVNISYDYTNALFDSVHQRQPRTALGISQDNRYLILVTIDGRQALSDGAYDYETAEFLQLFGAWNGLNLDGGGSTCMVKADECGTPVDINQNSYQFAVNRPGSQRPVGCNFGVYAASLPRAIRNVNVQPGTTTALLTWQTDFPADTQVQFGPTTNYGNATPLDSRLLRNHAATLTGLVPGSTYYFRAQSSDGVTTHSFSCSLSTTSSFSRSLAIEMTSLWKYSTNNLDGVNWTAPAYNDSGWMGPSAACLHIEGSSPPIQYSFPPRNTVLPPGLGQTTIFRTYYFRTPFLFSGSTNGVTLTLSNHIDDGAVFYLNGAEVRRVRMPAFPNLIQNSTPASGSPSTSPCSGDAWTACPDVATIAPGSLLEGTNMVAVEVHNTAIGPDMLFGSALFVNRPGSTSPQLFITSENGQATLYWNGEGFTLQRSTDLSSAANWADVPGPVTQSPAIVNQAGTTFFRLRN